MKSKQDFDTLHQRDGSRTIKIRIDRRFVANLDVPSVIVCGSGLCPAINTVWNHSRGTSPRELDKGLGVTSLMA